MLFLRTLTITIYTNLIETDILDVTFNLATGKFFPFRKPNNALIYVNVKSKHPLTVIKDLPNMISKRLSALSCNEDEFGKARLLYGNSLQKNGYKTSLSYNQTEVKIDENRS